MFHDPPDREPLKLRENERQRVRDGLPQPSCWHIPFTALPSFAEIVEARDVRRVVVPVALEARFRDPGAPDRYRNCLAELLSLIEPPPETLIQALT